MTGFVSQAAKQARNASFGVAASVALAAYFGAPTVADARDLTLREAKAALPPVCLSAGNELAQLKYGTAYYRNRERAAKERGAAADARTVAAEARIAAADALTTRASTRLDEANKEGVCLGLIMKDLEGNGTKTANLTAPPKKGEACKVAQQLKLVAGS